MVGFQVLYLRTAGPMMPSLGYIGTPRQEAPSQAILSASFLRYLLIVEEINVVVF